jgi:thiosulfate/3-mercaptopyruvate sulfurtransferase
MSGEETDLTRRSLLAAAAGAGVAGAAGCSGVQTPSDVAAAASVEGNVGYFRGPAQVDPAESTFVDARSKEQYRAEHVYGARHAPIGTLETRQASDDGLVPDAEGLASALGSVGIAPDDDVVVYGSSVGSRVSRVVFALEYLGHEGDVFVLNGGYEAWTGRVGVGSRSHGTADYDPDPQPDLVVTREWLADRVGTFNTDEGPGLLDVRPPEAYLGARQADALVASNARHGHLPGAVNVRWTGNIDGRELVEPGTLAQLYFSRAGLTQSGIAVVYGQGNVNPTNTWLVLRALGAEDVRLYEGGFGEWANVDAERRGRFPVETKTSTVIETSGSVGGGDDGGFSCTG